VDDLVILEASPVPREQALCRRLSRKLKPGFGFFVYGLLYFAFAAMSMWLVGFGVAMAVLIVKFGVEPGPLLRIVGSLCGTITFLLSWWPFWLWMEHERKAGRLLFREGQVLDATVTSAQAVTIRNARLTAATLEFKVEGRTLRAHLSVEGHPPALLAPGATCRLVYHPAVKHGWAYSVGQFAGAARLKGEKAVERSADS
jgi:hypothetical protein